MAVSHIFSGTLMCFLLTLATGSFTLGLGFGLGRKGTATMLITAYTFGSYLLTSFAAQVEWLQHVDPVSVFHYYKASEAIKGGLNDGNIIVLIMIAVITVLFGAFLFERRDVGTHNA